MALIHTEQFNKVEKYRNTVHKPTATIFTVFEDGGKKYFQIDTYVTAERLCQKK